MPLFEAPRRDEVYLLPLLTFYPFHCFGALEVLAAVVHLWINVSHSVLQLLHLFEFAMQFLLQFSVLVHFGV
jgi:hypothetical protein